MIYKARSHSSEMLPVLIGYSTRITIVLLSPIKTCTVASMVGSGSNGVIRSGINYIFGLEAFKNDGEKKLTFPWVQKTRPLDCLCFPKAHEGALL